jgi:outer membrane protein OmpA-like peptidoglycan-associated protein
MRTHTTTLTRTAVLVAGFFLLSACATAPKAPDAPIDARVKLTALQSNPLLATRAPVEMKNAEAAVKAAEVARHDDSELSRHLLLMADQKVEIARARAQSRQYEDQRKALSEQSERARLDARTLEADRARRDAQFARDDAQSARAAADSARADAASARDEVAAARAEGLELQRQIAELNARETDRGLVVTLGDLLFATGKSDLTGAARPNLNKLAAFLQEYEDRTVLIEGHTDSVGSEESNHFLSQRRAESVKSYLVGQGVAANRLSTAGLGQGSPVASNDTATGRQQNRRVEVIISNVARISNAN